MGQADLNNRVYYLLLLLIVVASCGLRFARLDARSLSTDETISVFDVRGVSWYWLPRDLGARAVDSYGGDYKQVHASTPVGLEKMIATIRHNEEHPPLFFMLLSPWAKAVGVDQVRLRLFPALFGTLAVLLVGAIGTHLSSRRLGLMSAALFAALPLSIFYSQELRPYSLLMCVGLAAFYVYTRLVEEPKLKWALLLGAVYVFGFYLHYFFGMMVLIQLLYAAVSRDRARLMKYVLPAFLIALLLFLPWVPVMRFQLAHTASVTSGEAPGGVKQAAIESLNYWVGINHHLSPDLPKPLHAGLWVLLLIGAIALWTMLASWIFRSRGRGDNAKLLAWHAALPFLLPVVFFVIHARFEFWHITKHYALLMPMAAIAIAWSLSSASKQIRLAGWSFIIAALALTDVSFYRVPFIMDVRTSAQLVKSATTDAALVVTENSPSQLGYWVDGLPNRTSTVEFPPPNVERFPEICLWTRTVDAPSDPAAIAAHKWLDEHMLKYKTQNCFGVTVESYRRR